MDLGGAGAPPRRRRSRVQIQQRLVGAGSGHLMAFTRPTLRELVDRIQADFVSRLPLDGSPLRVSLVYVLARVIAGAAHMLYGALEWLSRQLFADTSDEAALVRQAALYGITKTPATYATATV